MLRYIIVILLSCSIMSLHAQTKRIAFKSHSGNQNYFQLALDNHLFDIDGSNFGRGPERDIVTASLDSVIYLCDSVAVMVTSEHCRNYLSAGKISRWKAGKDTVINHPLFSKQHALDSIKQVLRRYYFFQNPVDKVVFIGFDNESDTTNYPLYFSSPVSHLPDGDKSFNGPIMVLLVIVVVLSVISGWVVNKRLLAAQRLRS